MFDKLIEFLLGLVEDILPVFIVKQYDRGILLRCGKFRKILLPGLHWKIPFFDKYEVRTISTTTLSIPTQSLTTKDGKQIVIKAVVKYNISDIKSLLLEVYDTTDAISDTTQAIIKEQITSRTWMEVCDNQTDNIITKKVRSEVRHWGIDVEKVTLTDIGIIKSLRLFNETTNIVNG